MYLAENARTLFPGASFAVAHCNFGLRGDESDGDEAFVRRWCEAAGMPLDVSRFDTKKYAADNGISMEMAARELRYRRFAELCRRNGYDAVAVAHNADDNAETFLLNLLRGTGTKGLRGMRGDSTLEGCRVLRPLLSVSRAEIRAWMVSNGKQWREDSSNADTSIKRNRLRREVLPAFGEINPSYLETMRRDMAHIAQADDIADAFWQDALARGLVPSTDPFTIDLCTLNSLGHRDYLLARALEPLDFSEGTLEALCRLLEEGGTVSGKTFEAPLWVLETSASALTVRPRGDAAPDGALLIPGPGEYALEGRLVSVETVPAAGMSLKQDDGTVIADAAALPFPFEIRHWRSGDWFRPLGMKGRKKLSDLFTDLKWSLARKREALVAVAPGKEDGHVAALLGVRPDEGVKVTDKTESIIRITIKQ